MSSGNGLTLYSIDTHINASTTDSFWKHCGKRRNCSFLLFPQSLLLNQKIVSPFVHIFDIISLFAAELEEPKIGISGKGLTEEANLTPELEFAGSITVGSNLSFQRAFAGCVRCVTDIDALLTAMVCRELLNSDTTTKSLSQTQKES